MSALAKVFVVFIFVLSVVFFGTSASLYLTRTDWKEQYDESQAKTQEALEKLEKHNESLTKHIAKGDNALVKVRGNERKLSSDLNKSLQDLQAKIDELTQTRSEKSTAMQQSAAALAAQAATESRATNLQEQLTAAHAAREAAINAQKNADKRMFAQKRELAQVQQELSVAKMEFEKLNSDYEALELLAQAYKKRYPDGPGAAAPTIDARIEDVDEDLGLVVLSVGKNDDVQEGYEFTVYRDDQFVAKVQVTRVYDSLSGARILLPEDASIRKGDRATTGI